MRIVFVLILVFLLYLAIRSSIKSRRQSHVSRTRLFSDNAEDITVRSADNVRLLSDAQLSAYEEESPEKPPSPVQAS